MNEHLTLYLDGYDLQDMIESYVRTKLGKKVKVNYSELVTDKIKNKHILNDSDNSFSLFLEYDLEEK